MATTADLDNTPNQGFFDLENVAWAKEAILALQKAGIVSGKSEIRFAPSDFVKREEFIKMLIIAFGFTSDGFEADFIDADKNAWYHPYLSAAQKAQIIYGDGMGNFGVGKNITREDMAVMLYRVLTSEGIELVAEDAVESFADSEEISEYAKDAVLLMQQANVINGMENGTFLPKKSSTRAEAAVMIYRILRMAEKM